MHAKVSEKRPSNIGAHQTTIKDVWLKEISPHYCYKHATSPTRSD